MNIKNFLAYNNAVPLALGVVFLGAGGVFAATNPEAIYSTQQKVISIDNSFIADKDLAAYTPKVQILGVTEDSDNYYVFYKFYTIDLKDYVWQEVAKDEEMKVSKADLGPYRDLGLYVTAQLKQIVDREGMRLKETQEFERKYVTHKVVATLYGGLVGKFLDSTTEELPGYTPVVTPPPAPVPLAQESASTNSTTNTDTQTQTASVVSGNSAPELQHIQTPPQSAEPAQSTSSVHPPPTQTTQVSSTVDTTPPIVQVLGDNPIRVFVGSPYADLGAVATDNVNANLGIRVLVNGVVKSSVTIDTTKEGEWTIRYESTDTAGNLGFAERKVNVVEAATKVEVTPSAAPVEATTTPSISQNSSTLASTPTLFATPTGTTTPAIPVEAAPPVVALPASTSPSTLPPPPPIETTHLDEVVAIPLHSSSVSSSTESTSTSTSTPPAN